MKNIRIRLGNLQSLSSGDTDKQHITISPTVSAITNSQEAIIENGNKTINKIRINNSYFYIKRIKMPFHPLFIHEYDRLNDSNNIIINVSHNQYKRQSEELLIRMAASMYFSKLSMTDPNVSRFIDRISNNIELAEDEF